MKYWYLKNGDIVGPLSAEEIAKDELFASDSLVCPEDKAEQADFWKPAQDYAEDFAPVSDKELEMLIPQEISLEDIDLSDNPKQENSNSAESPALPQEQNQQEQANTEEKNPFETDRPQIAPNIEDTLSNHAISPLLDASGDTLLEDIPAKAILDSKEDNSVKEMPKQEEAWPAQDTVEDAPILNIFENSLHTERNKTKQITDISENIYNTYGSASAEQKELKVKGLAQKDEPPAEEKRKNNKIYLLLILMFLLIAVALLLALFGTESEAEQNKQQAALPAASADILQANPINTDEGIDTPTTDAAAFFNNMRSNDADQEKALAKVKGFILPTGQTIGNYLNQKYASYQTDWATILLSGKNYCVNFNASKIRQERIVYSFSIDLDKNEINGLNNLGMDLLVKGE